MLNTDSIARRRDEVSLHAPQEPVWQPWGLTIDSAILCRRVRQVIAEGGIASALDVGCSVGLTSLWSAWQNPGVDVHGIDPKGEAIAQAQRLAARFGAGLSFRQMAYAALGDERFDLVFSNPPYIPDLAGVGGMDPSAVGVDLVLDMLADPFRHVSPGGRLVMVLSSTSLACTRVRSHLKALSREGLARRTSSRAAPFRVHCVLASPRFTHELERAGAITRTARGAFMHHVDVWEFAER